MVCGAWDVQVKAGIKILLVLRFQEPCYQLPDRHHISADLSASGFWREIKKLQLFHDTLSKFCKSCYLKFSPNTSASFLCLLFKNTFQHFICNYNKLTMSINLYSSFMFSNFTKWRFNGYIFLNQFTVSHLFMHKVLQMTNKWINYSTPSLDLLHRISV